MSIAYFALDLHYADVDLVLVEASQRPFVDLSQKVNLSLYVYSVPTVVILDLHPAWDGTAR